MGGSDDESDKINLMIKKGVAHRYWHVGSKMAWRVRLGSLDQLGGLNGYRAVQADQQMVAGGRNRITTIGS